MSNGALPPGCTQQMCDEAQPGYFDPPPCCSWCGEDATDELTIFGDRLFVCVECKPVASKEWREANGQFGVGA